MILLRQDPPFDLAYVTTTHLLERIHPKTLVVNDPAHVRNAPEKMFVTEFPDLMPPTLVTRDLAEIKAFRAEHGDIVMKPLYGHGGGAVFRITRDDLNFGSLYDMFSVTFREQWVVQKFLPDVKKGDKRILLVDGEFAGAVNRIPAADDLRSNMVRGGAPAATDLTPREQEICKRLGPALRERGLLFAGIDVIGDWLTEINVTSPTGIRAVKNLGGPDAAALIWDKIEAKRRSNDREKWEPVFGQDHAQENHEPPLTIATTDYDHFRDFRLGLVRAEGIEANWLTLGHHEIFSRFTFNREWDVSELSFAKFAAQVTRENSDIIGLPVYASRLFRFSSFYVNQKQGHQNAPRTCKGKRIGVPEWAHTAAVYMRGWLMHEGGVPLADIDWVQAGTNEAGRIEKVELTLPKGVRLTAMPDKTLSGMIASGELDCVIIARPPNSFREKHPDVVRLFPDYEAMEQHYYEDTRVYPIMHVIALRKAILDGKPWIARNLYNAFEESKRRSLERILDPAVSRYPVPWLTNYATRMRQMFGGELFPYGIEANRPTLELFLRYCHEQGIAHRLAKPEEIFPAGIMASVKI